MSAAKGVGSLFYRKRHVNTTDLRFLSYFNVESNYLRKISQMIVE